MRILIVGLGLIGGSFARAIKAGTTHTVVGLDRDEAVVKAALKAKAIDLAADGNSVEDADLVIVAVTPQTCVDFIKQNAARFKSGAVVMDICGVKGAVYDGIADTVREHRLRFVGAHPMAGKERGGFANSSADLFAGASLIITPEGADSDAVATVRRLALDIGFAMCKETDMGTHDRMIAYTSQLAHVLACSYVRDPLALGHRGFSAGSFRDVTRVATIDENMWSELFLENKAALSDEIGVLISNLAQFKAAIDSSDREKLRSLMKESRLIKDKI